jgi:hypothetical protein
MDVGFRLTHFRIKFVLLANETIIDHLTDRTCTTHYPVQRLSRKHTVRTEDVVMRRHPTPHVDPSNGVVRFAAFSVQQNQFLLCPHRQSLHFFLHFAQSRMVLA